MNQPQRANNATLLWSLIGVAAVYGGLLLFLRTLTGDHAVDGIIGVILGLYICSHPAANAINALFFSRAGLLRMTWSTVGWLGLNFLVIVVGWLAIFTGARRIVD